MAASSGPSSSAPSSSSSSGASSLPSSPSSSSPSAPARTPWAQHSAAWVIPGTVGATLAGASLGAGLAAVLNRPLGRSSYNVASKLGLRSLLYLGTVAACSNSLAPELANERVAVHCFGGATTGFVMGGLANATGRLHCALRGGLLGTLVALPIYWMLEGRVERRQQQLALAQAAGIVEEEKPKRKWIKYPRWLPRIETNKRKELPAIEQPPSETKE